MDPEDVLTDAKSEIVAALREDGAVLISMPRLLSEGLATEANHEYIDRDAVSLSPEGFVYVAVRQSQRRIGPTVDPRTLLMVEEKYGGFAMVPATHPTGPLLDHLIAALALICGQGRVDARIEHMSQEEYTKVFGPKVENDASVGG